MELSEKIKQLRTDKSWTQEELAGKIFVSRTAISKWESGRGYPSIDSLKALSAIFGVSLDQLLSNDELISVAENDSKIKSQKMQDLVFASLDSMVGLLFFLPFFGQAIGSRIQMVSLLDLSEMAMLLQISYIVLCTISLLFGLIEFIFVTNENEHWRKSKVIISLGLMLLITLGFILSRQPYAAVYILAMLVVKGIILIYQR